MYKYLLVIFIFCIGCVGLNEKKQLAKYRMWLQEPEITKDMISPMIGGEVVPPEAFAILMIQGYGNTNDIPLVEKYLSSDDLITRKYAFQCIRNLKRRGNNEKNRIIHSQDERDEFSRNALRTPKESFFEIERHRLTFVEEFKVVSARTEEEKGIQKLLVLSYKNRENEEKINTKLEGSAVYKVDVFVNNIESFKFDSEYQFLNFMVFKIPSKNRFFLGDQFVVVIKKSQMPNWIVKGSKMKFLFGKKNNQFYGLCNPIKENPNIFISKEISIHTSTNHNFSLNKDFYYLDHLSSKNRRKIIGLSKTFSCPISLFSRYKNKILFKKYYCLGFACNYLSMCPDRSLNKNRLPKLQDVNGIAIYAWEKGVENASATVSPHRVPVPLINISFSKMHFSSQTHFVKPIKFEIVALKKENDRLVIKSFRTKENIFTNNLSIARSNKIAIKVRVNNIESTLDSKYKILNLTVSELAQEKRYFLGDFFLILIKKSQLPEWIKTGVEIDLLFDPRMEKLLNIEYVKEIE